MKIKKYVVSSTLHIQTFLSRIDTIEHIREYFGEI